MRIVFDLLTNSGRHRPPILPSPVACWSGFSSPCPFGIVRTGISGARSYKSAASDSWDFVATFFNAGKDFRAEIRQNAGKVQNADRLD
jgi:hypothetical protein